MDENYYVLNVKVRENLTDARAIERMKAWDFTLKEWQAYIKVITPFSNKYAERIVRFFVEYDKVDLCPDLFGAYEPLKETFDKKSIEEPSSCIAFPAGTLMMKKRRRFDVAIENQYYGAVFDPQNNYMVIPSKRKIGEYLGNIRIIIKKNTTKFTLEQLQTIVDDMCLHPARRHAHPSRGTQGIAPNPKPIQAHSVVSLFLCLINLSKN